MSYKHCITRMHKIFELMFHTAGSTKKLFYYIVVQLFLCKYSSLIHSKMYFRCSVQSSRLHDFTLNFTDITVHVAIFVLFCNLQYRCSYPKLAIGGATTLNVDNHQQYPLFTQSRLFRS